MGGWRGKFGNPPREILHVYAQRQLAWLPAACGRARKWLTTMQRDRAPPMKSPGYCRIGGLSIND